MACTITDNFSDRPVQDPGHDSCSLCLDNLVEPFLSGLADIVHRLAALSAADGVVQFVGPAVWSLRAFFLLHYWHPPSLFNLSRTVHADLESFLFCFSIGGTAAVGYHVVTGRPLQLRRRTRREDRLLPWSSAALAAPILAFGMVLLLTGEVMWAGLTGFLIGTAGRLICRTDLTRKTLLGGLLFFGYYILLLFVLKGIAPGYLNATWDAHGPAAARCLGLPATELLFGLGFGLYWSGLVEQIDWVFGSVESSVRQTAD